ncbi:linear amide C-N hydrolase [uncultured Pseudodesulfovibrio sp.]|uniref:linear amide C-N hydrolase n=1 Tax=uncultured Pseudodesulfovibrio sp. TaxID=2035858 RepID=UPI0029C916B3|nr:linear amide C-N hydrolase [uncultured Pseudodesulfovibrio sp.]
MSHSRFNVPLFLFFVLLLTCPKWSQACTGMRVMAQDGSVAFARSLEFGFASESNIMVAPRGLSWTASAPDGKNGMQWTSKYAFVGPNAFGLDRPLEGMNEKSLYVAGFWMTSGETLFPTIAPADYQKSIAQLDMCAWILSNYSTIAEVKDGVSTLKLTGVALETVHTTPLAHWYVMDKTGKAIVIEYIDGKLHLSDNPVGVVTNAPYFGWHLDNLRNYINLRPANVEQFKLGDYTIRPLGEGTGLLGLPGDMTPPSRFVRAAFFANTALQPADADSAVTLGMNLIANFSIPKGITSSISSDGKKGHDYTQWTTVYDLNRQALYFRTYINQDYKVVHFDELPLDGAKLLSIPMWGVKAAYENVSNEAK